MNDVKCNMNVRDSWDDGMKAGTRKRAWNVLGLSQQGERQEKNMIMCIGRDSSAKAECDGIQRVRWDWKWKQDNRQVNCIAKSELDIAYMMIRSDNRVTNIREKKR